MSISTKTGDDGTTGLLFNRRVPKDHPRIEAYSACDELNAAMGLAKAYLKKSSSSKAKKLCKQLYEIQQDLVFLMGELALLPEDRERYQKTGRRFITKEDVDRLTKLVEEMESKKIRFDGWSTPGESVPSAALHVARGNCRRAERRVFSLGEEVRRLNPDIIRYLNRLSDVLWLMAKLAEKT